MGFFDKFFGTTVEKIPQPISVLVGIVILIKARSNTFHGKSH